MRILKTFFYAIWSLIYGVWFLVVTSISIPFFLPFFLIKGVGLKKIAYSYGAIMAKVTSFAYLVGNFSCVKIIGKENLPKNGKIVVVGNHQGYCDVMVMVLSFPFNVGFIAKRELFYVPVVAFWLHILNCVPMDRKSPRDSVKAILKGISHVEQGIPMIIFPEGTRSRSNQMRPFKAGSFKLALKPEALIVPVTIDGAYKLFEEYHLVSPFHRVRVTIHPPIDTAKLSEEEKADLPTQLAEKINAGLQTPNEVFLPPKKMK